MDKIKILLQQNIKLFFKNRILVLTTLLFPIVFYVFFSVLFTSYDDVHKIPVAVIDHDQSRISIDIMDKLNHHHALNVTTPDLKEAEKLLENNRIEAIFILKEGFEDKIKASDYEDAIQLIHLDKSAVGPALSDILASEVMMPIAVYKAANESLRFEKSHDYQSLFTKTEAKGYQLIEDSYFEMSVESSVIVPNAQMEESLDIANLLKLNTTIGYSLIVLTIALMFANGYLIDNWSLKERLVTIGYRSVHLYLGEWLSVFLTGSIIILIQLFILYFGLDISFSSLKVIALALILHIIFLSHLVIVISSFTRDKRKYQSIIAPLIFFLGLLGGAFWTTELLSESVLFIARLSPIYWTLNIIKDSMLQYNQDTNVLLNYFLVILSISPIILGIYSRQYKANKH